MAGRERLATLYGGLRKDEWFLLELLPSFPLLLDYRTGVGFIGDVDVKILDRCIAWDNAIFSNISPFLKHDSGYELVRRFITVNRNEARVADKAQSLLAAFTTRTDALSRELVLTLITLYKSNAEVLSPLIRYDWVRSPDCALLVALIESTLSPVWRLAVGPFVADPLAYCGNPITAPVVAAVLRWGEGEDQDPIIDALLPDFGSRVLGDPDWTVAKQMISVGTVRQKLVMAEKVEEMLVGAGKLPGYAEEMVLLMLWALPARARTPWVERRQRELLAMALPQVAISLRHFRVMEAMFS
jgi:hypothetical protein